MRPSDVASFVTIAFAGGMLLGCSHPTTELSARAVVDASELASKQDNFDELLKYASDDCVLHQRTARTGAIDTSSKSCRAAVEDSRKALASAKAQGSVHNYVSEVFSVEVQGDKAIAKLKTVDTFTNNGHVLEAESHQTETLQQRNGQWLVTQIDAESEIPTMDGRRIN